MAKAKIIYQAKQEVSGKHQRSRQWVSYLGKLTVYDRKTNPVILHLESDIADSLMSELMPDTKEFKGDSITQVYAKLSRWYRKNEINF